MRIGRIVREVEILPDEETITVPEPDRWPDLPGHQELPEQPSLPPREPAPEDPIGS